MPEISIDSVSATLLHQRKENEVDLRPESDLMTLGLGVPIMSGRKTDLDVEDALLKLKRYGIEVDKSELVDLLLGA